MNRRVVEWLESAEGEAWSRKKHHSHLWRLVDVKSDDPSDCDVVGGDIVVFLWHCNLV